MFSSCFQVTSTRFAQTIYSTIRFISYSHHQTHIIITACNKDEKKVERVSVLPQQTNFFDAKWQGRFQICMLISFLLLTLLLIYPFLIFTPAIREQPNERAGGLVFKCFTWLFYTYRVFSEKQVLLLIIFVLKWG